MESQQKESEYLTRIVKESLIADRLPMVKQIPVDYLFDRTIEVRNGETGIKPAIPCDEDARKFYLEIKDKSGRAIDSRFSAITYLQVILYGLGFKREGEFNGYFDEETQLAVMHFQRTAGLPESGRVDEETRVALNKILDYMRSIKVEKKDSVELPRLAPEVPPSLFQRVKEVVQRIKKIL